MPELPDDIENTVLHVEAGAARLPLGHVEIGHLWTRRERGCGADLLVNRAENPIVDLQAEGVDAGLLFEQRCWR